MIRNCVSIQRFYIQMVGYIQMAGFGTILPKTSKTHKNSKYLLDYMGPGANKR
jgi:hypothetical protein